MFRVVHAMKGLRNINNMDKMPSPKQTCLLPLPDRRIRLKYMRPLPFLSRCHSSSSSHSHRTWNNNVCAQIRHSLFTVQDRTQLKVPKRQHLFPNVTNKYKRFLILSIYFTTVQCELYFNLPIRLKSESFKKVNDVSPHHIPARILYNIFCFVLPSCPYC